MKLQDWLYFGHGPLLMSTRLNTRENHEYLSQISIMASGGANCVCRLSNTVWTTTLCGSFRGRFDKQDVVSVCSDITSSGSYTLLHGIMTASNFGPTDSGSWSYKLTHVRQFVSPLVRTFLCELNMKLLCFFA